MIKIKVECDNDIIKSIRISGHANYDEYGKDIVCASVSSIAITNINLAIKFDKDSIKYESSEGLIEITVLKEDKNINLIFSNMIDMFKELEEQYKNNIKFI